MSLVLVDHSDEHFSLVTLNRPAKRNALSIQLLDELRQAVASAVQMPGKRAMIIAANGPVFCAGLDLAEAGDESLADRSAELLAKVYLAIATCPLITIAAASGAALGGGAGLLSAVDFAIGGDDLRVGYPEVRRGLVAALVTCLIRRQVSDRVARELILLGQTINVARATMLGLVNQAVAKEEVLSTAISLARQSAGGAPGAIARSKKLLDNLTPRPIEEDIRMALSIHLSSRNSAEAAEGVRAFVEKREPKWSPQQGSA